MNETTALPLSETLKCEASAHIFVDNKTHCRCGQRSRHVPPGTTLEGPVRFFDWPAPTSPTPASSAGREQALSEQHIAVALYRLRHPKVDEATKEQAETFVTEHVRRLTAALSEAQAERDKARDAAVGWSECIAMAQETLDALIYLRRAEKGKAAMFLPEAIRNACILVRDEALAYAEDEYRAALTAKDSEIERLEDDRDEMRRGLELFVDAINLSGPPRLASTERWYAALRALGGWREQHGERLFGDPMITLCAADRADTGTTTP